MVAILPAIIYVIKNDCITEAAKAIFEINTIYSNSDSGVNAFHESILDTILDVLKIHPILSIIIILELVSIIFYRTKKIVKLPMPFSFMLCLFYTIFFNRPYTYYYTMIIPYLIPTFLIGLLS